VSKSDLLIPISTKAATVEVPKPRELLIEIPQGDLWIGSSDEIWKHMVEPWIGDSSSEWPTVNRAWIGTEDGLWRQWYPNESTGVKLLMVEKSNNGAAEQEAEQHFWVGDWPVGSYPTPSPSTAGSWGSRKTVPIHAAAVTDSEVVLYGIDWNPFTQVLCVLTGENDESNYWVHRSTDYGDTWDAGVNVSGVSGTDGIFGHASGLYYPDIPVLGAAWNEAYGVADSLRYVGQNRWMLHFSDGAVYMFSDDDGVTWHAPGGGSDDGTAAKARHWYAQQWATLQSLYPNSMDTNWQFHATDGPFRDLISSPPTSRTVAWSDETPFVGATEGVGANQWNASVEWYTLIQAGQGFGSPPWVADGSQANLVAGDLSGYTCVPGTSTKWLYCGEGNQAVEMVGIIPHEKFRPSDAMKAIGQKAFVVSAAYQANIYVDWPYGNDPDSDAIFQARIRALPNPDVSGGWRAWLINGQTGTNYAPTICYSDDQGTTWTTQADYGLGGGTMAEWLGNGQHPFFWPGFGTLGGAPLKWTFPFRMVTDIVFHPDDPDTLLSIGFVNAAGIGWCMAPSYDGGNTWSDIVEFTGSGSGGPATAWGRLIPLYTATGIEAGEQIREVAIPSMVAHAPAVLTGDQTAAVTSGVVVHAPAVTASLGGAIRVVTAAPLVLHAPAVTTSPTFAAVGSAMQVLHAPAVTNNARTVGWAMIVHAPAVTTSAPARLVQYRAVKWAMVAHAPAVTTSFDQAASVSVAITLAYAPSVVAAVIGVASVAAASMVAHAPTVTTVYDQSVSVGPAVAVMHAPAVTVTEEEGHGIAGSPIGGAPIGS
jgi:hypothetical protein